MNPIDSISRHPDWFDWMNKCEKLNVSSMNFSAKWIHCELYFLWGQLYFISREYNKYTDIVMLCIMSGGVSVWYLACVEINNITSK